MRDEQYLQNRNDMLEMLDTIEALLEEVEKGGGEEAMARLRKRDKLPIRERIALALDRDSPFWRSRRWRRSSQFHRRLRFIVGIGVISESNVWYSDDPGAGRRV